MIGEVSLVAQSLAFAVSQALGWLPLWFQLCCLHPVTVFVACRSYRQYSEDDQKPVVPYELITHEVRCLGFDLRDLNWILA